MKWYFYLIAVVLFVIIYFVIKKSVITFKTEKKNRKSETYKTYIQYIFTGIIAGIILMILQLTISSIQKLFSLEATSWINAIDTFLIGLVVLGIGITLAIFVIARFFSFYPEK